MSYPADEKCKPRIKLSGGEWYAYAANRSPMAAALMVPAINFVRSRNERRRADQRKTARRITAAQGDAL